ncbi:MAG: DUF1501 domain-containing protein, partial [Planctomycetaceae bacterium]|nr:DUF1501 domain-containing protein [Planctomycetaceae bacterium]
MITRRNLLKTSAAGFGYVAMAALAHDQWARADELPTGSLASREPHFPARAKRVIFLCMEGGPSHLDTFDYKPQLIADNGKPAPTGRGVRGGSLLAPTFEFRQHGESGQWVSELFPEVAKHVDQLCFLKGMHTNLPSHAQAFLQMHCGIFTAPRPGMGAWVLYGLGSANENLPGYVTINPPRTNGGSANYGAAFLPAIYQGTRIDRRGFGGTETVSNLQNHRRTRDAQRVQLDFLQQLNRSTAETLGGSAEVEGLISAGELAFRMQGEMPEVLDLSQETRATQALYGIEETQRGGRGRGFGMGAGFGRGTSGPDTFGRQCLLARRLLEAGVRFVEITMGGWDHHFNLNESLQTSASSVDQPIAGLLTDLEQRGLLKDTLVLWGGEFGRSAYAQGTGRDHNAKGFTMWMAGGGV